MRGHPVIYLLPILGARPLLLGRAHYLFIFSCSAVAGSLCAEGPIIPNFLLARRLLAPTGMGPLIIYFSCSAPARSIRADITLFIYSSCSLLARSCWAAPFNYLFPRSALARSLCAGDQFFIYFSC